MPSSRSEYVREKVALLIRLFKECIAAFDKKPPFAGHGQLEYHRETIQRRLQLQSAAAALNDDLFLRSLYKTLQAWGIGRRGSRLLPYSEYVMQLQSRAGEISSLDGLKLDDATLDTKGVGQHIWSLIETLGIVNNQAKLVAGSKALHHILPDLVVPVDRRYTRVFFGWHDPEFQYDQKRFFRMAFENFVLIAREAEPAQYVGQRWHTSQTKVMDNALVGFELLLPRMASVMQETHGTG